MRTCALRNLGFGGGGWPSSTPPGCGSHARCARNRYVEIGPISPGMARIWAKLPLHEGAAFDTRLDDIAATVCHTIPAPQPSAAPMPRARSPPARPAWHAAAGTPSAPPQRRYRRQLRW